MKSIKEQFELLIDKKRGFGPFKNCWTWDGNINNEGYGRFTKEGKLLLAHRVAYELFIGKIPNNLLVLHHCDIRHCVNPNHLYVGTDQDNTNDKVKRERQNPRIGEQNGRSKLTETEVMKIRELRKQGYNGHYLAKIYNVTPGAIYHCSNSRTWKHLK